MKARLLFHQGPMIGRVIEVDEPREVIENYIDTGWCEYVSPSPEPEAEPVEEEKPPKAKKPPKPRAKKKTSKARAKKLETPEG